MMRYDQKTSSGPPMLPHMHRRTPLRELDNAAILGDVHGILHDPERPH